MTCIAHLLTRAKRSRVLRLNQEEEEQQQKQNQQTRNKKAEKPAKTLIQWISLGFMLIMINYTITPYIDLYSYYNLNMKNGSLSGFLFPIEAITLTITILIHTQLTKKKVKKQ